MEILQPNKYYTRQDVRMHSDVDDCWIIVSERVYDVTNFLKEHPGGGEIILEYAGMDATMVFRDKGHSHDAYEMLSEYCIGYITQGYQLG